MLAGVVLQTGVTLGDNVIVNTRASVDHDCVIERDVMIGPGAVAVRGGQSRGGGVRGRRSGADARSAGRSAGRHRGG